MVDTDRSGDSRKHKIVFVQLVNDYSGSPKILRDAIGALRKSNVRGKLYVGTSGPGFLSEVDAPRVRFPYFRGVHRVVTLVTYTLSQVVLMCQLLVDRSIAQSAVVYVNTLLPFGAAIYGRLTGRAVVYHLHEVSLSPPAFMRFLVRICRFCSSENIYVSRTHAKMLPIDRVPSRIVYNSLDESFRELGAAAPYCGGNRVKFRVLMMASLRPYKGIAEFLAVAKLLEADDSIAFELVLNESRIDVAHFMKVTAVGINVEVHGQSTDVARFLANASLVLNLSRVDLWVETFGMTILEAMAFGVPVIVPPIGGPAELVDDFVQGFHVDSRDVKEVAAKILLIQSDADLSKAMSNAARIRALEFSELAFQQAVQDVYATACRGSLS